MIPSGRSEPWDKVDLLQFWLVNSVNITTCFNSRHSMRYYWSFKIFLHLWSIGFNPLSPLKSDRHQISPCNINALWNRVVMRITDMITCTRWICLIFYQLLSTTSEGNEWGNWRCENSNFDLRVFRVNLRILLASSASAYHRSLIYISVENA